MEAPPVFREGAENGTRGRVRSPFPTAWMRLSRACRNRPARSVWRVDQSVRCRAAFGVRGACSRFRTTPGLRQRQQAGHLKRFAQFRGHDGRVGLGQGWIEGHKQLMLGLGFPLAPVLRPPPASTSVEMAHLSLPEHRTQPRRSKSVR